MKIIGLESPPGGGKNTQSQNIIRDYGFVQISTGDIFRREIKAGTPLGIAAQKFIDKGLLVPDVIVFGMLVEELKKIPDAKGFILDGYPRTKSQASLLIGFMKDHNVEFLGIIHLVVPDDLLLSRQASRIADAKQNNQELRSDDTPEKLKVRLGEYHEHSSDTLQCFRDHNLPVFSINGDQLPEKVYEEIKEAISPVFEDAK